MNSSYLINSLITIYIDFGNIHIFQGDKLRSGNLRFFCCIDYSVLMYRDEIHRDIRIPIRAYSFLANSGLSVEGVQL